MSGLCITLLQVRSGHVNVPKSTEGRFVGASAVRFEDMQIWAQDAE